MMHMGGDEVIGSCWTEDTSINNYMKKNSLSTSDLWKEWHNKVVSLTKKLFNNDEAKMPY